MQQNETLSQFMDKKLQIFTKANRYRIGKEYIVLLSLLTIIFLSYFINFLSETKNELLEAIGILLIIITFPYMIILAISNFFRYERLNGKLHGNLIFEKDKICFDNQIYYISEIEKIEILNFDIRGDFVNTLMEFKPHKSNGVKNYVKLHLKNGKMVMCYFFQSKSEKVQIFREEFKVYFSLNLLSRQNFLNITEE